MALYKEPYMFEVNAVFENNDFVFSAAEVTPNQLLAKYQSGIPIFMQVNVSDFPYLSSCIISLASFADDYCIFTNKSLDLLSSLGAQSTSLYLLSDGSITMYDPSR